MTLVKTTIESIGTKSSSPGNEPHRLRLLPDRLFELITQIYESGQITLSDHYGLLTILFDPTSTPEELEWIDRLRHAVYYGYLDIAECLATELDFYTFTNG